MAYRTTDIKVKEILPTTTINTTPFIKLANVIITNHLTGKGLSTDALGQIELWLAAHIAVATKLPQKKQQTIGTASEVYHRGILGKGLESTEYGKMVIMIDTTGTLISMGKPLAQMEALASDSDEYS